MEVRLYPDFLVYVKKKKSPELGSTMVIVMQHTACRVAGMKALEEDLRMF